MGVLERAAQRQAKGEAFVLATVVRTVAVTAAKAGAKALVTPDGAIEEGWIGGGCARAAVIKAAKQCLADGRSRLVSIAPKEGLDELGVAPGEVREGVSYAKNACPSQGTMDIFVEPVLPKPRLTILGVSPVAVAIANLAPAFGFEASLSDPANLQADQASAAANHFVVVSTQGAGDRLALKAAALMAARYVSFVGSRRKAEALRRDLIAEGVSEHSLARIKAPAGLDISAITAEEIALSILAEMIAVRRTPDRADAGLPEGAST